MGNAEQTLLIGDPQGMSRMQARTWMPGELRWELPAEGAVSLRAR
jgi:hypothetical protein